LRAFLFYLVTNKHFTQKQPPVRQQFVGTLYGISFFLDEAAPKMHLTQNAYSELVMNKTARLLARFLGLAQALRIAGRTKF